MLKCIQSVNKNTFRTLRNTNFLHAFTIFLFNFQQTESCNCKVVSLRCCLERNASYCQCRRPSRRYYESRFSYFSREKYFINRYNEFNSVRAAAEGWFQKSKMKLDDFEKVPIATGTGIAKASEAFIYFRLIV